MRLGLAPTNSRPANKLRPSLQKSYANVASHSLTRRHHPDHWLLITILVLLAVGLTVIFSISPALSVVAHTSNNFYTNRQLLAIVLGLIAFVIASQVPFSMWRHWSKPLVVAAMAATLLAVIMPVNPNYPAHRWVRLGSLSFQSVELLKFAVLIWLASMLAERIHSGTIKNVQITLRPVLIALGIIGVIVAGVQSDLGSTGVIVVIIGSMLYVAGMPLKRLAMILGIIIIGLIIAITAIPYRRARLMTYLHPSSNCQASGYQACQALIAVGSGGMVGLGLGSSVQAYGYLPEAANDSIFAIYAEKFGFIGAVALLGVFVALFARLKQIAERAPDDFSRLLVVGILAWLSIQSLINVGAMIGLLPLKGITLPFVSYGGTSIIFVLAAIGIVFQISRYTTYSGGVGQRNGGTSYAGSIDRRRVGGAYHPNPGNRD